MASNDALIGRALAGRYRLQQRRGAGAHGIVLDAVDEQLQRPVAVKIMLPQFVSTQALEARFRLEAQVAGSLNHPNLNAVYDWGVEEVEGTAVPYLVLEHLGGGSLRDMLDRGRLLTPSQALMVGLDACRGLDYMHKRSVIHRDLKPANLAFGDDRHLRILDIGISRMVAEQTWKEPTAAGLDAAHYASPEQARGGSPQDGTLGSATDIYSLCLVMIEAVTGQVPFSSDSTVATLNARLDKLMPVSADFGPLASVLSRAGSAQAADRYSAAEFGQALVQAAEKLPRPALLPIVATNGFGEHTGGMRRPGDPTGPLQRSEPTLAQAIVLPSPAPDPIDARANDQPSKTGEPAIEAAIEGAAIESAATEATPNAATTVATESTPARPAAPATEVIGVLASTPPQLNIVMANADAQGTPHTSAPPPPALSRSTPVPPPTSAPAEPTAFPSMPVGRVDTSGPAELSISLATEQRPTSSGPTPAGAAALPGVGSGAPLGAAGATSTAAAANTAKVGAGDSALHIAPRVLAPDSGEPRLYDQSHDEPVGPTRRRRTGWIVAVLIVVVAAAAGAFVTTRLLAENSYTMPDLVGQPEAVARNEISGNDWSVVVQKERNDEQPLGNVIRTDPVVGVSLKEGSTVIFVVSEGPSMSILPDVAGQTLEAATATLAAVNLDIVVGDEVYCESVPIGDELQCAEVPAGSVISAMVAEQPLVTPGMEVTQHTVVSVTLSKGPAPRALPNLKGLDEPTAIQTMTDLGLVLVRAPDIFSDEYAAGLVADQSLPEGTELQRGESIAYAVSQGPEVVPMPTIEGQTYDQLFAAIKAARLDVGTVTGPTDGTGPLSSVSADGQPVTSGQLLPIGTKIDLAYSPPPPPPETTPATTPASTPATTP